jgi:hypothetical protein
MAQPHVALWMPDPSGERSRLNTNKRQECNVQPHVAQQELDPSGEHSRLNTTRGKIANVQPHLAQRQLDPSPERSRLNTTGGNLASASLLSARLTPPSILSIPSEEVLAVAEALSPICR